MRSREAAVGRHEAQAPAAARRRRGNAALLQGGAACGAAPRALTSGVALGVLDGNVACTRRARGWGWGGRLELRVEPTLGAPGGPGGARQAPHGHRRPCPRESAQACPRARADARTAGAGRIPPWHQ